MRSLSNPLVGIAIAVFALAAFAVQIIRFYVRSDLPKPWGMIDFDIFHIVGSMTLAGELAQAYAENTFRHFQKVYSGGDRFMPWTYPPQYGLVVAPLATVNIVISYVLFVASTLAAYLFVIFKLGGQKAGVALVTIFPAAVLTLLSGQNGFLTGALIGGSALLLLRNSPAAGVTLGLMTIKPHLAAALGVYCIAARNWPVVAAAAATVFATSLLATFVFGADIWLAFLHSVAEAGAFLDRGAYQMYRMTSAYATMHTLGFGAGASLAAQMLVSFSALALVVVIAVKQYPQRLALGLTVLLGLFVSPYAYDYDLPILGVAIALLLPELERRATMLEQAGVVILAWGAAFWGLGMQRAQQYMGAEPTDAINGPSLGGLFMLLLLALVWRVVRREQALEKSGGVCSATVA